MDVIFKVNTPPPQTITTPAWTQCTSLLYKSWFISFSSTPACFPTFTIALVPTNTPVSLQHHSTTPAAFSEVACNISYQTSSASTFCTSFLAGLIHRARSHIMLDASICLQSMRWIPYECLHLISSFHGDCKIKWGLWSRQSLRRLTISTNVYVYIALLFINNSTRNTSTRRLCK